MMSRLTPHRAYTRSALPIKTMTAIAVALALSACGKARAPAGGMPPGAGGPPEVGVYTVEPQTVAITSELPGRTVANVMAEIRPQIGGIVQSRPFHEGGEVKAGELLFQIDPAVYQANYESAKAGLAKAEANLVTVRLKFDRYQELISARQSASKLTTMPMQHSNRLKLTLPQAKLPPNWHASIWLTPA